jgi:Zn-dependent M28 family amino/carboxypeptidase
VVAAFDGEEAGLVGSRSFVRALPIERAAIVIDVNADMIGRDPGNTLFVTGVPRQPFLRPFIERVVARAPVKLVIGHDTPPGSSDDWTKDSDQYAFMEAGIPALYFGVEDYDHLHQPSDDYETMTFGFYVRAVETLIDVIREFDAGAGELAGRDTRRAP